MPTGQLSNDTRLTVTVLSCLLQPADGRSSGGITEVEFHFENARELFRSTKPPFGTGDALQLRNGYMSNCPDLVHDGGHCRCVEVWPLHLETRRMHPTLKIAKYNLGQVVRHREHPFRGVVFDVDPEFANTEEWYESIPEEARPARNQPFYHLYAETEATYYVAYVSEQNLVPDPSGEPLDHPEVTVMFGEFENGRYPLHVNLN